MIGGLAIKGGHVTFAIQVGHGTFLDVNGIGCRRIAKADVKGVGFGVVSDLHGDVTFCAFAMITNSPSSSIAVTRSMVSASSRK